MPNTKNTGLLMKQPADAAREQAVEVRFGQVGIMQVRLRTTKPGEILDELTGKTATAPHFFDRTPVALDLSSLPKTPTAEDIRGVIEVVKRAGMMTVGLVHGGTAIEELANDLELPVIHHVRASTRTAPVVQAAASTTPGSTATAPGGASAPFGTPTTGGATAPSGASTPYGATARGAAPTPYDTSAPPGATAPTGSPTSAAGSHPYVAAAAPYGAISASVGARARDTAPQAQAAPPPAPEPAATPPALMQHQPVRSGQRVYARNRDLIVTAPVAAGAEVMADGCVHVYGPLRGRVMAGAHGDTDARVFCQSFHAELVSIAGVFRVFETIPPDLVGMPVQAWLAGDDLKFAKIGE
jgi:septum formation inhibitor MinC